MNDKEQAPNVPQEYTIDQVHGEFSDQWILMRLTGSIEDKLPEKGEILVHSANREDISEFLANELDHKGPYYVFRTEPEDALDGDDTGIGGMLDLFIAETENFLETPES